MIKILFKQHSRITTYIVTWTILSWHQHQNISSTGVVPLSMIASLFPELDRDMICQLLCHLEFCHEITDPEILALLQAKTDTSPSNFFSFLALWTWISILMCGSLMTNLATTVGGSYNAASVNSFNSTFFSGSSRSISLQFSLHLTHYKSIGFWSFIPSKEMQNMLVWSSWNRNHCRSCQKNVLVRSLKWSNRIPD